MISENQTLLGIQEGFSQADLRSAYRDRVRLVHPDLATSDADRDRRTRETIRLNAAYAELRRSETPKGSQSAPQKVAESGERRNTHEAGELRWVVEAGSRTTRSVRRSRS